MAPGYGFDTPCVPSEGTGGEGDGELTGGVMVGSPEPMDRIPAIVSVVSTVVACVALVVNIAVQVKGGVTEGGVGVPGVGVDFGGVGGGVFGLDGGLYEVMDAGQFVVQSGQLSGAQSPWVVKYFVEYFTPFTGLLPLVRDSGMVLALSLSPLPPPPTVGPHGPHARLQLVHCVLRLVNPTMPCGTGLHTFLGLLVLRCCIAAALLCSTRIVLHCHYQVETEVVVWQATCPGLCPRCCRVGTGQACPQTPSMRTRISQLRYGSRHQACWPWWLCWYWASDCYQWV